MNCEEASIISRSIPRQAMFMSLSGTPWMRADRNLETRFISGASGARVARAV